VNWEAALSALRKTDGATSMLGSGPERDSLAAPNDDVVTGLGQLKGRPLLCRQPLHNVGHRASNNKSTSDGINRHFSLGGLPVCVDIHYGSTPHRFVRLLDYPTYQVHSHHLWSFDRGDDD